MAEKLGKLTVVVETDLNKLKKDMGTAQGEVQSTANKMTTALKAVGAAFIAMGALRAIKEVTAAFKIQEMAVRSVQTALEQQGGSWLELGSSVKKTASALQDITVFGDEETMQAMAKAMNAGMNYADVIKDIGFFQDVAAATTRDLGSVTEVLARAYGGEMSTLTRLMPIVMKLKAEERSWLNIRKLIVETYGGRAAELAKTYTGQLQQLSNQWNDLKEKAGEVMLKVTAPGVKPVLSHIKLINTLLDEYAETQKRLRDMELGDIFSEDTPVRARQIAIAVKRLGEELDIAGEKYLKRAAKEKPWGWLLGVGGTDLDEARDNLQKLSTQYENMSQFLQRLIQEHKDLTAVIQDSTDALDGVEWVKPDMGKALYDLDFATVQLMEDTNKLADSWDAGYEVWLKTRTEAENLVIEFDKLRELFQSGVIDIDTYNRAIDDLGDKFAGIKPELEDAFDNAEQRAGRFASIITSTFKSWALSANKSIAELGKQFAITIAAMIAEAAVFAALMTMVFGATGGFGAIFKTRLLGSAKGNVFNNGDLERFQSGGIVQRPTLFPMRSGMGLMGEAGPEAIMPLTRLRGGELGVKATIEGFNLQPSFNITLDGEKITAAIRKRNLFDDRRGIGNLKLANA